MGNETQATKATPPGWPRVSSSIFYDDAAQAITWICTVLGSEVRLKVEGDEGEIVHSELTFGDGLIMVGSAGLIREERSHQLPAKAPKSIEGSNTQTLAIFVDDVDAHCAHAKKHGATIVDEPVTHDYGEEYWADRTYRLVDPEGHHWWFMQRVKGPGA